MFSSQLELSRTPGAGGPSRGEHEAEGAEHRGAGVASPGPVEARVLLPKGGPQKGPKALFGSCCSVRPRGRVAEAHREGWAAARLAARSASCSALSSGVGPKMLLTPVLGGRCPRGAWDLGHCSAFSLCGFIPNGGIHTRSSAGLAMCRGCRTPLGSRRRRRRRRRAAPHSEGTTRGWQLWGSRRSL